MTTLDEDKAATMVKLIGALEDDDDVRLSIRTSRSPSRSSRS
jgi:transcriptional/translational regulatory protein YebC/TACO1